MPSADRPASTTTCTFNCSPTRLADQPSPPEKAAIAAPILRLSGRSPYTALGVGLAIMIAAVGVATTPRAGASPAGRSISCPELQLFGVRGSGERHSDYSGFGRTIWDVRQAVQAQLPTSAAIPIDYPAIPVVLPASRKKIPSFLHYILTGYHTSEIRGIKALSKSINSFVAACPVSYLALAGFSQGAQVAGDTYLSHMTAALRSRVVGVVMLGDPDFNGSTPAVDRGTYSNKENGVWAFAHIGRVGHSKRHVPAALADRVSSYCSKGDPICNFSATNALACGRHKASCPHNHYPDLRWDGRRYTQDAANFLVARFRAVAAVHQTGLLRVSAAPDSTQAWAIGNDTQFMECGNGYVVHYDGRSWSPIQPGIPADVALTGVAALSRASIWIGGNIGICGSTHRPYLARSSGGGFAAWNISWLGNAVLQGLSGSAPDNLWAVGYTPSHSSVIPLALRWNGQSWTKIPPPSGSSGLAFSTVSVSGTGNVWVIENKPDLSQVYAIRWNGQHWSSRYPFTDDILQGIATSSPTQAWVVGFNQNTSANVTAHWNGGTWTPVNTPTSAELLNAVTMTGSRAWAVGSALVNTSSSVIIPAAFSSTGGSWTKQAPPDPGDSNVTQAEFFDVAAASPRFVVAIGQNGTECSFGPGFADIYTNGVWRTQRVMSGSSRPGLPLPSCGG